MAPIRVLRLRPAFPVKARTAAGSAEPINRRRWNCGESCDGWSLPRPFSGRHGLGLVQNEAVVRDGLDSAPGGGFRFHIVNNGVTQCDSGLAKVFDFA